MTLHAINAERLAISEYTGLSLLGLAVHDGVLYGVTATELVEFTGSTDSGTAIAAHVQSGKLLLDRFEETRYTRSYVKDHHGDALSLITLIDQVDAEDVAAEESVSYEVPAATGSVYHAQAVRLRSDLKGTGWAWKLANVSGGGMKVRGWTAQPSGIEVDV